MNGFACSLDDVDNLHKSSGPEGKKEIFLTISPCPTVAIRSVINPGRNNRRISGSFIAKAVKKSLESNYPGAEPPALRPIHDFVAAISQKQQAAGPNVLWPGPEGQGFHAGLKIILYFLKDNTDWRQGL